MLASFRTFDRPALPARGSLCLSQLPPVPCACCHRSAKSTRRQQPLLKSSQHPPHGSPQLSAGQAAARECRSFLGTCPLTGQRGEAAWLKLSLQVQTLASLPLRAQAGRLSSGRLGFLICKVGRETELSLGSAGEIGWPGVPALRGPWERSVGARHRGWAWEGKGDLPSALRVLSGGGDQEGRVLGCVLAVSPPPLCRPRFAHLLGGQLAAFPCPGQLLGRLGRRWSGSMPLRCGWGPLASAMGTGF